MSQSAFSEPAGTPEYDDAPERVPCAHCREPIAAESFVYWKTTTRLLSASCPACNRRTTMAATTMNGWAGQEGA